MRILGSPGNCRSPGCHGLGLAALPFRYAPISKWFREQAKANAGHASLQYPGGAAFSADAVPLEMSNQVYRGMGLQRDN